MAAPPSRSSNSGDLDDRADDHYEDHLARDTLGIWVAETSRFQQNAAVADQHYDQQLARRSLDALRDAATADLPELRRREKMFNAWRDHNLKRRVMETWVTRHRENVAREEAEQRKNVAAGKFALGKWMQAAREMGERKEMFRMFFMKLKLVRRWREFVRERIRTRQIAEYEQRYNDFRRKQDLELMQKGLSRMKLKADESAAMETQADEHFEQSQAQRTSAKAHEALTSMYTTAAESSNKENAADDHYNDMLAIRVLSSEGQWRKQTRVVQEREEVADEFRAIKDEEAAKRGLRTMRNTAAWGQKMEDEADEFYERKTNELGRQALSRWRDAAATRRGETVVREAPATPAARMAALRQYQQNQRES